MEHNSRKESNIKNPLLNNLHDSLVEIQGSGKKTKTEGKSELPNINHSYNSSEVNTSLRLPSLDKNKHLKYLYHEFCKQSYMGGGNATFDQISQSADKMTLNKWMVFCKQFDLTKKLPPREIRLIFRKATNEQNEMNIQSFCEALERIQIQAKISNQELVQGILHADSHDSARNRICSMKVNFSGPKKNFFIQSRLTENVRNEEKVKQKVFKQKKEREYILHQGKFREHIHREMKERKEIREERNRNLRNFNSTNQAIPKLPDFSLDKYKKSVPSPYSNRTANVKAGRTSFDSYSKIFYTNRSAVDNPMTNFSSLKNGSDVQSKSRLKYEKKRQLEKQDIVIREFQLNQKDETDEVLSKEEESPKKEDKGMESPSWQIDSDVESDQILKSHFENEKKIKEGLKKSRLEEQEEDHEDNEDNTDFMITRYN